jgi:peptidoglycan hydrolase-like protein with peptidoglycan-binding domain
MQPIGHRHIAIVGGIGLMLLTAACSHKEQPSSGSSTPPPQPKQAAYHPPSNVTMMPVTRQTVQQLQRELQHDGFYTGRIDGIVGPETRAALATYQRRHGLEQTAALDWPTLQQLASASQSRAAAAKGSPPAVATPSSGSTTAAPAPGSQPAPPSGAKPAQPGQTTP